MRRFWNWISGISTAWGVLPSSIAATITGTAWIIIMAALGYLETIPVFWIMMGVPVGAAAIITFIVRFSEWRTSISAAGKLVFVGPHLVGDYVKKKDGKINAIARAQVRLLFQTPTRFPIAFIIDEFHTSFEGHFPPNIPRTENGSTVSPNEIRYFSDHRIEMNNVPIKEVVNGTVQFKLRYGHPGREKYQMQKNLTFAATFQPNAGGYVIISQQDIL